MEEPSQPFVRKTSETGQTRTGCKELPQKNTKNEEKKAASLVFFEFSCGWSPLRFFCDQTSQF